MTDETPKIGDNKAPVFASFEERQKELLDTFDKWAAERPEIEDEEQETKAKNLADMLKTLEDDVEIERVKLVTPLNEAKNAIQAEHRIFQSPIDLARSKMATRINDWINKKRAVAAAKLAKEKADADAERQRLQAIADSSSSASEKAVVAEKMKQVDKQEKNAERATASAGRVTGTTGARATGQRTKWTGEITNNAKFLRWLVESRRDALLAYMQMQADSIAKSPDARKAGADGLAFKSTTEV